MKRIISVDASAVIESNFIVYAMGYEHKINWEEVGNLVSTYARPRNIGKHVDGLHKLFIETQQIPVFIPGQHPITG